MSVLLGYVRVSTGKQFSSGLGLEAQVTLLQAEADRKGMTLEIVREAEGASGKSTAKRYAFNSALDRLDKGEAQGLAVATLDRLGRGSVSDFLAVLDKSKKGNWILIILDYQVDTSTPTGEAMAIIGATFAQLERKLIGERTKKALAVKKAQGVRLGRPLAIDDLTRQRIKSAHANGYSLNTIAKSLNNSGQLSASGGKWYASTIRAVVMRAS